MKELTKTEHLIEELNEEDQQLKTELEMLVERLQVRSVFEFLYGPTSTNGILDNRSQTHRYISLH